MGVKIKSFRGITYNKDKVKIEDVVAPPYDVISPEEQEKYYKKSEYNIIRLILGKIYEDDDETNNRYTRARDFFKSWLKEKILIQDSEEKIYYLEEDFEINGKRFKREGFIVLIKLEEFEKGNILPHEKTLRGPKIDRFNLIKECRANFSQIFGIFSDPLLESINLLKDCACSNSPYFSFKFNNIDYSFWKLGDKDLMSKLKEIMENKVIFIADGHHRYETALEYRNFMRKKLNVSNSTEYPFDYVMIYLCPMEDDGLIVLPTHRLVKNIELNTQNFLEKVKSYFEITKIASVKEIQINEFIFYDGKNFYHLKLKNKIQEKLDVEILEELIFKNILKITEDEITNKTKIDYIKDEKEGIELVKNNQYSALFIVNPPTIDQIKNIALKKGILPQKSTFFYPKLLTGLVINSLE